MLRPRSLSLLNDFNFTHVVCGTSGMFCIQKRTKAQEFQERLDEDTLPVAAEKKKLWTLTVHREE
jgi:hypothetical protein